MEVEVGQEYIAYPSFSILAATGEHKENQKGTAKVGRVIHVNRRSKTVTLAFEVKMGILKETFFVEELGKRVR